MAFVGLSDFMGANPFRGSLEGVGPENPDFFGPRNGNERSECHLGPKKSRSCKQQLTGTLMVITALMYGRVKILNTDGLQTAVHVGHGRVTECINKSYKVCTVYNVQCKC
jgi:hypothetical protein